MTRTYKIRKTTRKPKRKSRAAGSMPAKRQRGGRKEVEKVIIITAARKKAGARGSMPAALLKKRAKTLGQNGGAFSKEDLKKRSNTRIELPYRNVTKPMPSFRTFE